jgi:integrase/recombinase XerD
MQFSEAGIKSVLEKIIRNTGIRQVNHTNQFKRQCVSLLHGFRKWYTKQLVDSKVNPEIREMLLGHKIGLAGVYYRPTAQDMLNEYMKAIPLLTISDEERLKFKLEERIQIEKTELENLQQQFNQFRDEFLKRTSN